MLSFMIYTNLELSATNYILLFFVIFPTLLQVLLNQNYLIFLKNNILITKSITFVLRRQVNSPLQIPLLPDTYSMDNCASDSSHLG